MISLLLRAKDLKHVSVFSVHEPPTGLSDRLDRAEGMLFIKEGFSWGAAIFSPFWLAAREAWLALAGYFVAVAAILGVMAALSAGEGWTGLAIVALHAFVGLEAANLYRRTLDRSGWIDHGTVSGRTEEDCERRFFDIWLSGVPAVTSTLSPVETGDRTAAEPSPGLWGMFGRA